MPRRHRRNEREIRMKSVSRWPNLGPRPKYSTFYKNHSGASGVQGVDFSKGSFVRRQKVITQILAILAFALRVDNLMIFSI